MAEKGPPEGWAKWRPRLGAYLDELEATSAECRGWIVQPMVIRNLTPCNFALVQTECDWGNWVEHSTTTVHVKSADEVNFECQGTVVTSVTGASGIHVGMHVVEIAGRRVAANADVDSLIGAAVPCTVRLSVVLSPPQQLEPWSVATAVAEGSNVAPSGCTGFFVYRSSEGHELCFVFSSPALWWRSVGVTSGPTGTDWAEQWRSGALSEHLESDGVGPVAVSGKSPTPFACVSAYHATGGSECCFVVEPPGAAPVDEEEDEGPGNAAAGTTVDSSYYDILGVQAGCSESAIRKGYYKKAQRWHPDKNRGDKNAEENFKRIGHAYSVLIDPERRRLYDLHGAEWMRKQEEHGGRGAVMRDSVDAMLGSGALKEEVGDWEVLRQVDPQYAADRARPEEILKREQDLRNAERIKALACSLDVRMQHFVDNEKRWRYELRKTLKKKAQATPGSGRVVFLVGYAYRQTARQSMSRCCGVQAALEFQRECCHRCGRECALVCKYASIAHLQYWQHTWQQDLDKMDRLADEVGAAAPDRARGLNERVAREESVWRNRQKKNADDVDAATLVLLEEAQKKLRQDDLPGAADDLRSAATQQRGRIEQEYQKRLTAAGLSVLYEQGSSEAEEVARKSSGLWLRMTRSNPDYRRVHAQAKRMLLGLEILGDAYMAAGDDAEVVDFDGAATKVAQS
eukprot:TRINITY_DN15579_c0_g1_i1.p1 TRINITY_DN15579_c0_g1~~TRINITY_DN15579_c0_g1_i1.p1  ORF type:complete len:702 (+),score=182.92 TRINITY_DN15579_c0_g1_i1:54-2108(+)